MSHFNKTILAKCRKPGPLRGASPSRPALKKLGGGAAQCAGPLSLLTTAMRSTYSRTPPPKRMYLTSKTLTRGSFASSVTSSPSLYRRYAPKYMHWDYTPIPKDAMYVIACYVIAQLEKFRKFRKFCRLTFKNQSCSLGCIFQTNHALLVPSMSKHNCDVDFHFNRLYIYVFIYLNFFNSSDRSEKS
jgi:hypothetical protein